MPIEGSLEDFERTLQDVIFTLGLVTPDCGEPFDKDCKVLIGECEKRLQNIADIRASVPDGLGDELRAYKKYSYSSEAVPFAKAAKLLQKITATQHNRDNERD